MLIRKYTAIAILLSGTHYILTYLSSMWTFFLMTGCRKGGCQVASEALWLELMPKIFRFMQWPLGFMFDYMNVPSEKFFQLIILLNSVLWGVVWALPVYFIYSSVRQFEK